MAKLEQGTLSQSCGTCGAYQSPDGTDIGLCFEERHKCKRAKSVRETNVCCYWHKRPVDLERPVSLADRIFAVLLFSNGGAPRSCREICDLVDLEFGGHTLSCDVARVVEHQVSHGRIVQAEGATLFECSTWIGRYQRILNPEKRISFSVAPAISELFEKRFVDYCAQRREAKGGAQ